MPKYEVIEGVTVFDEFREVGTFLEIDEASAFPLVESGNLKLVEEPTPESSADLPPSSEGVDAPPSPEAPVETPEVTPEVPPSPSVQAPVESTPATPEITEPAPEQAPVPTPAPAKSGWVGGHTV